MKDRALVELPETFYILHGEKIYSPLQTERLHIKV